MGLRTSHPCRAVSQQSWLWSNSAHAICMLQHRDGNLCPYTSAVTEAWPHPVCPVLALSLFQLSCTTWLIFTYSFPFPPSHPAFSSSLLSLHCNKWFLCHRPLICTCLSSKFSKSSSLFYVHLACVFCVKKSQVNSGKEAGDTGIAWCTQGTTAIVCFKQPLWDSWILHFRAIFQKIYSLSVCRSWNLSRHSPASRKQNGTVLNRVSIPFKHIHPSMINVAWSTKAHDSWCCSTHQICSSS